MERILILGATGNIGALTAERLSKSGAALRLASSRQTGVEALRAAYPDAEVVQADWYDRASLSEAMKGIDRVLVVTPDFVTDETVVTPNVIEAARQAGGISQIVRLIAIPPGLEAADLSPETLATRCGAAQHVVAKPLFDASGLPMTYLNVACWIMFNLPWFMAEEVKSHERLVMPAASDAPRRWVSEEDVAEVIASILTVDVERHVGQNYLMTGAEQYDFVAVARLLSEATGKTIPYVDDDSALKAAMGDNYDTLMTYFAHETRDYRSVPPSDAKQKITGTRQTTLPEYIAKNVDLFV